MSSALFYSTTSGLTRTEVEKIVHEMPNARLHAEFLGTFSKDTLPPFRLHTCSVINIQDSVAPDGSALPGTHWVCAGVTEDPWYFDSFGLDIPIAIKDRLSVFGKVAHTQKQIQACESTECGWYSVACCDYMTTHTHNAGHTLDYFTSLFDSPILKKNDETLKNYINKRKNHSGVSVDYRT